MASDEFEIIQRYFNAKPLAFSCPELALGIGDDCALLELAPTHRLAMSMDLLQEGVHFLSDADPYSLGKRSLLVNLSDLAAMGARPVCFTLGVSLPHSDEPWLQAFSQGLAEIANAHQCPLVGGDLTSSNPRLASKTICIQVHGDLPANQALLRSGAKVGDQIYVTGTLGDAAAGLAVLQGKTEDDLSTTTKTALVRAFFEPESRIAAGQILRPLASSCIDLSDGLASDLTHILKASGVGAKIELSALPMSPAFCEAVASAQRQEIAIGGGDDYELCFTIAPSQVESMLEQFAQHAIPVQRIGTIEPGETLQWQQEGREAVLNVHGYNHFTQQQMQARGVV